MTRCPNSIVALILALVPSVTLADALIPAINAYRNTSAFYIMFAGVVLIETLCIRLGLRRIHLASVLWRVMLVNCASSVAGDVLFRSRFRPDFYEAWQQAIPFFALTLCVELPLLVLLLRPRCVSWRRTLILGTVANVLSYAFLVIAERPVEAVWLHRLSEADQVTLLCWNNQKMLGASTGRIYGTESDGYNRVPPHRLRFFDIKDCKWHPMTNCPPMHPGTWDVEGDVFAFVHDDQHAYAPGDITVRRLPDFSPVSEISITNATPRQSCRELKVSPDRTKLAVLVPRHEIRGPLGGSSYRCLGMTCDLMVFDLTSGALVGVAPRKALQGLCWLPDSRRVLFSSLRHAALHELTTLEKGWQAKYAAADQLFADAPTYAYDSQTGSVVYFGDMHSPHLAAQAGLLVYRSAADTIQSLDLASGRTNDIMVGRLGYSDIAVSPDGRLALVHLRLTNPMAYLGYPTIVDLRDPSRRYYLPAGFDYRLTWTAENGSRASGPAVPLSTAGASHRQE